MSPHITTIRYAYLKCVFAFLVNSNIALQHFHCRLFTSPLRTTCYNRFSLRDFYRTIELFTKEAAYGVWCNGVLRPITSSCGAAWCVIDLDLRKIVLNI